MNLTTLRDYVRDLTGIYSTDLLSNSLLDRWLQESYTEVNREEDWPWMTNIITGTLAIGSTTITLTNPSGKIKEFSVTYPNSLLIQIPSRRGLIQTVEGDDEYFYDCDSSNNIVLSKAFGETMTYKISYIKAAPLIDTVGASATELPSEYVNIIAYRTAVKVLFSQSDDTNRPQFYSTEYARLLDYMKSDLVVDHDLGPIQIGGEILRVDGRTAGTVNLRYRSS
jgi:hypothetical protein